MPARRSIIKIRFIGTLLSAIVCAAAVAALAAFGIANLSRVRAQSASVDWQTAAGGHMEFDVASVKLNKSDYAAVEPTSNIPLGPMDAFSPTGGLLQATNWPLLQYLVFAYKLTPPETLALLSKLPRWTNTNHYDIQGRTTGNPTKDQFRIMMQALLANRFKLAVHYETQQEAVFGLVLDKPGKMGPKLRLHPINAPCSTAGPPLGGQGSPEADGFPVQCGAITYLEPIAQGRVLYGARNIPMSMLATFFSSPQSTGVNHPLMDKTGLNGNIDFLLDWTPEVPAGSSFHPDPNGPTFLEALKDQLGLKLISTTSPMDFLVIDHIEEPSEN